MLGHNYESGRRLQYVHRQQLARLTESAGERAAEAELRAASYKQALKRGELEKFLLEEQAQGDRQNRVADSRLNHVIKGACGGALTNVEIAQIAPRAPARRRGRALQRAAAPQWRGLRDDLASLAQRDRAGAQGGDRPDDGNARVVLGPPVLRLPRGGLVHVGPQQRRAEDDCSPTLSAPTASSRSEVRRRRASTRPCSSSCSPGALEFTQVRRRPGRADQVRAEVRWTDDVARCRSSRCR